MSLAKLPGYATGKVTDKEYKDSTLYKNQFNVINNHVVEVQTITVHTFVVGDVDDPEIYAAQPMWEWEKSECGKWIMERAVEAPTWHQIVDVNQLGYRFAIRAKLKAKDVTYFRLKWGNIV